MAAVDGSARSIPTLPVAALAVGALSIVAWLVPGVIGMMIVGVAGTVAVLLGTGCLLTARGNPARARRLMGTIAVVIGLVGLMGLWVTAVLVATIPG